MEVEEKKLKRKIFELETIGDVVKELNLSLDLDAARITEIFSQAIAGLFLMENAALILLTPDKPAYLLRDDDDFRSSLNGLKPALETVFICAGNKVFFADEIKDDFIRDQLRALGIAIIIPMVLRKELKGIYLVGRRINGEGYSREDASFLFTFANQVMVTLENAYSFQLLQRHVAELIVLNEITEAINSGIDTGLLLDMVLRSLTEMFGALAGFILILWDKKDILFLVDNGLDADKKKLLLEGRYGSGLVAQSLNSQGGIKFFARENALSQEKGLFLDKEDNVCYWACRSLMIHKENITGVVGLAKKDGDPCREEDINLFLTFTNQLIMVVLNARLFELAITDGLTGLFIHRYFEQRLREEVSRVRRCSSKMSVIVIDVDHLKQCNDLLGHQKGNELLKKIAEVIKLSIQHNEDIPCRWGGDEFMIILPETPKNGAQVLAERIRRNVAGFKVSEGCKSLSASVSIGIAAFPEDAVDEKDLLEKADNAMYQAKKNGGNSVVVCGAS